MTKNGETITFTKDEFHNFLKDVEKSAFDDILYTTGLNDITGDVGNIVENGPPSKDHFAAKIDELGLKEVGKRAVLAQRATPILSGITFGFAAAYEAAFATEDELKESKEHREQSRRELLAA